MMAKENTAKIIKYPNNQINIPNGFLAKDGKLYSLLPKTGKNESGEKDFYYEEKFIMHQIPVIKEILTDCETGNSKYKVAWKFKGATKERIVKASAITTKKELLALSDQLLNVNENNYKDVMKYLNEFVYCNEIPDKVMTSRIGHTDAGFIHPLIQTDVVIDFDSDGEEELFNNFQEKGTVESWKEEVLKYILPHPKAMVYLTGAFASVLLRDLKVQPFVMDMSGSTSLGKSTVMFATASVYGTSSLVSEEGKPVGIERKVTYLNSFPFFFNDTKHFKRKEDIEPLIYHHAGGKAKLRGSLEGFRRVREHANILFTNGEACILEYTEGGGCAGRVVTLQGAPFDSDDITKVKPILDAIYKGIDKNHGVVGRVFVEKWLALDEEKKERLTTGYFESLYNYYSDLATGNEVLVRLARFYSALHFTADLLNDFFDFGIDLEIFTNVFQYEKEENKAVDKGLQHLVHCLEELERRPTNINYDEHLPQVVDAHCNVDEEKLLLTSSFVKQLFGKEHTAVRRLWLKQGYIIPTSAKDSTNKIRVRKGAVQRRGILLNTDIIKSLGFDGFFDPKHSEIALQERLEQYSKYKL